MPQFLFHWSPEIEEHLADNFVTRDEFEHVDLHATNLRRGRHEGRFEVIGRSFDGRRICCVFEVEDDLYCIPVTAVKTGRR